MMSKKSKAEVIAAVREHYWKAKKAQKSRILDELIATTGYITNMRLTCCAMRNEGRALRNQAGRKSIVGMSSRFWNKWHAEGLLSEHFWKEKLDYIHHNPVRKGYVQLPEHWRYSSAGYWLKQEVGDVPVVPIQSEENEEECHGYW